MTLYGLSYRSLGKENNECVRYSVGRSQWAGFSYVYRIVQFDLLAWGVNRGFNRAFSLA